MKNTEDRKKECYMYNMVYLIGRLKDEPKIKEENGKEVCESILEVQRYFNNDENKDSDLINIKLLNGIAKNTVEYVHKGDLVGCKGRLETNKNNYVVIVEKISFLTSNSKSSEEE